MIRGYGRKDRRCDSVTDPKRGDSMGITIIVILLIPLLFQVFMSRQEQRRRHEEIMNRLADIENKLAG